MNNVQLVNENKRTALTSLRGQLTGPGWAAFIKKKPTWPDEVSLEHRGSLW